MDKNIGVVLDGRYEVQKRIGVGGMADVYRAFDIEESREVAVKILKNEFINNDEFLQRFKNESKAVSMLSHPNIVKVLDVGFNEDLRYIVMEYIDGITIRDYIEAEGKLDWKETSHLIIQILRALQHAHDRGIIHRDIKPQNIMMFSDGTIKVMDFGIAKFTYELGITATAQTIGSVHYISPEQASGKTTDGKSDIYSTGILMYEMLTGKKPFDTDNPVTVALMQMNNQAELPRTINPDIPRGIEEIVLKAIEKDPADRYQFAKDMIKDIETFKNSPDMVFGYTKVLPIIEEESKIDYQVNPDEFEYQDLSEYGDYTDSESYHSEINEDEVVENNYYIGSKKPETEHDENVTDDFPETESKKNGPLVKVFSVLTVVAMIALIFGLSALVKNIFSKPEVEVITMPKLVQYDYNQMIEKYSDSFQIKLDGNPVYSIYEENAIVSQSVEAGMEIKKGDIVYVKISNGKNVSVVPKVEGMMAEDAIKLINDSGFGVAQKQEFNDFVSYNRVIRVEPGEGTEMDVSNVVTLYVSKGSQIDARIVPNVLGKTKEEAEKTLTSLGFTVRFEDKDDKAPEGQVVAQSIPDGTLANPNETIIVHVSTGKPPVATIPMTFNYPERAYGIIRFIIYMDDEVYLEQEVNVEEAPSIKFEISGSEKKNVKIEMCNTVTNVTALLGTYKFDFEAKKFEIESENVQAAFEAVGAIKPEETTTSETTTTTEATTTTQQTTVTEPPATDPPVQTTVTEAPVITEPPVTTVPTETEESTPPATEETTTQDVTSDTEEQVTFSSDQTSSEQVTDES